MTQTLAVNQANDIYLNNDGNIAILTGLAAVLQSCQQYAQAQLGEMVLQTDQGVPYMQSVWGGVKNIQQFTAALRAAFLSVPDVLEVVSLLTSQVNNVLIYNAVIRTIYGSGAVTNG